MSKFAKLSQVKKNSQAMKQLLEEDLRKITGGQIANTPVDIDYPPYVEYYGVVIYGVPPYVEYYGVVMYGLPPW